MRDIAIVATSQAPNVRSDPDRNEVEMLMPVIADVRAKAGLKRSEIGFVCSGSSDYLVGVPFSFVGALDAYGAWPPISESHVEMDGAFALYEAWVKLMIGEVDTALVYAFGKSSLADIAEILTLQQDPYTVAPLWPDYRSLAALQARTVLEHTDFTAADMAAVAVRDRAHAKDNPNAQVAGDFGVDEILAEDFVADPLRKSDCAPVTDGCVAVVLAAGDAARDICDQPAWIREIDHRIEPHALGARDLTVSESTRIAAEKASASGRFDIAEITAPFTHQSLLLEEALGLDDSTTINPSGGALAANPVMATGLIRFAEAAERIMAGNAGRALVHATSGACLQQNMVSVLEAN